MFRESFNLAYAVSSFVHSLFFLSILQLVLHDIFLILAVYLIISKETVVKECVSMTMYVKDVREICINNCGIINALRNANILHAVYISFILF